MNNKAMSILARCAHLRDIAEKTDRLVSKNEIGTEHWIAPESVRNGIYTQKSDIYSAGLVFGCWLSHIGSGFVYSEMDRSLRNPMMVPSVKKFLSKLLSPDPNNRYTAEEALQDPFLN
jgi:serine/threonine protein kinase